jgi:hypothetical protein
MAARLIIEIDGSQHGTEQGKARDEARTRWLEQEGYRVLRFWNNDLTSNIEGVLETIHAALYGSRDYNAVVLTHERRRSKSASRHPTPPACGGRPSPSRALQGRVTECVARPNLSPPFTRQSARS